MDYNLLLQKSLAIFLLTYTVTYLPVFYMGVIKTYKAEWLLRPAGFLSDGWSVRILIGLTTTWAYLLWVYPA